MKKMVVLLALVLAFGISAESRADFSQAGLDPVSFWVVDGADTGSDVNLSLTHIDANFFDSFELQYKVDGGSFTSFDNANSPLSIATGSDGGREQVFFKLVDIQAPISPETTYANLTFQGDGVDGLYDGLLVNWVTAGNFTFGVTSGTDKVAPVPVPAAALLLVPGLVGIIGVQRRKSQA